MIGSSERHGFGCAFFVLTKDRGDLTQRVLRKHTEITEKGRKRSVRCKIWIEVEIEVLRASLSDALRMTTLRRCGMSG